MALPFGVSWLCTLLWCCVCLSSQNGNNFAHGFVSEDELGTYADVLVPPTSDQPYSGEPLNTNYDSFSQREDVQPVRQQSFVALKGKGVTHHHNKNFGGSLTALGKRKLVQSNPDYRREQDQFVINPMVPLVKKYGHVRAGYHRPLDFSNKDRMHSKTAEGVSFPTINDFKRFIESMKSSFLMPGSDKSKYFQTAHETIAEMVSLPQNIKEEPSTDYNTIKSGSSYDARKNILAKPTNTVIGHGEERFNYQMPSESLTVSNPVITNPRLSIGPHPGLFKKSQSTVIDDSSNIRRLSYDGISEYKIFPNLLNKGVQSNTNKPPSPPPPALSPRFSVEDSSFGSFVTAAIVNSPRAPIQDFRYHSSKAHNLTSLSSKYSIQQPKHASHGKESVTGIESSTRIQLDKFLQSKVMSKKPQADILSAHSYGKSIYIDAPRGQLHIPDGHSKYNEKPATSIHATVGKKSNLNDSLRVYQPRVHVSSADFLLQSGSSHRSVQTSKPHKPPTRAFVPKPPGRFHFGFVSGQHSSYLDLSRHEDHKGDHSLRHPSILAAQNEKFNISKEKMVSLGQDLKQMSMTDLANGSKMQEMSEKSFVSLQKGPVSRQHSENDAAAIKPLSKKLVGNESDTEEANLYLVVPSTPFVRLYEQASDGHQKAFDISKTVHAKGNSAEQLSFMATKNSHLKPGSEMSRQFQTTSEMQNPRTLNTQNIGEELYSHYGSTFVKGSFHDGRNATVQGESMNVVSARSEEGSNYKMPSGSVTVANSIANPSIIPTTMYRNHEPHSTVRDVSKDIWLSNAWLFTEKPVFTSTSNPLYKDVKSFSYRSQSPPLALASRLFSEGFVTAAPVKPLSSPSKDFRYTSSKAQTTSSLNSEYNVQQPNYESHENSFTGYKEHSGGIQHSKLSQRKELGGMSPADIQSAQKHTRTYTKSMHFSVPRGHLYIPNRLPKPKERITPSIQTNQGVGKGSNDVNRTSAVYPQESSGFGSSSDLLHMSSSSRMSVQGSRPPDPQIQAFATNRSSKFHPQFLLAKPSSYVHVSRTYNGLLGDRSLTRLSSQTNDEKTEFSKQKMVSLTQVPKQNKNLHTFISSGLSSSQNGFSSQGTDYGRINTKHNLVQTSVPETLEALPLKQIKHTYLGNKAVSGNAGTRKYSGRTLLGEHVDQNAPISSSTKNGPGSATTASAARPLMLPINVLLQKPSARILKSPSNLFLQPRKQLSVFKHSISNPIGFFQREPVDINMAAPPRTTNVVNSRRSYTRTRMFFSKTSYTPSRQANGQTVLNLPKPAANRM